MGVSSDAAFGAGDLMRRTRDLERQVRQFAAARRLEGATIGAGGLRVKDGGRVTVEDASGDAVDLSTLAFGMQSANATDLLALGDTSNAWVDLSGGPALTTTIGTSGRALVSVSAALECDPSTTAGWMQADMAFKISGATTRPATDFDFEAYSVKFVRDDTGGGFPTVAVAAGRQIFVTGLNAGVHTFTTQYRVTASTAGDECNIAGRNITVMPF